MTVAAVVVLALASVIAHAAAVTVGVDDAVLYRLEITTTSDWASVSVTPGAALDGRVVSSSGGEVSLNGSALTVQSWPLSSQVQATVEVLYRDPDGVAVQVQSTKGYRGTASVRLTNVQTGALVLEGHNDRQTLADSSNAVTWSVDRARLFEAPLHLPRADNRRLVLAFYYPWFDRYDDPTMTDQPSQPRSTYRHAGVDDMTSQAAANGVDGFVVSWAGDGHDGPAFDVALRAAETRGQLITGYLETELAARTSNPTQTVTGWVEQLLQRSGSHAFLTWNGRPVVFVYGMDKLSPTNWRAVTAELRTRGHRPLWLGDTGAPAYADITWGEHRYPAVDTSAALTELGRIQSLRLRGSHVLHGAQSEPWVATVSPGYDDHLVRSDNDRVDRDGGRRYDQTWQAALASDPDWIVVTSWNEWFEGTSIEPSVQFGDRALRQTAELSALFKAGVRQTLDGLFAGLTPLASRDSVAQGLALSRHVYAPKGADVVVVVGDDPYADALASQPLAGRKGPILLVPGGATSSLPRGVADEVRRVLTTKGEVLIVGGPRTVSTKIEETIRSHGHRVTRIAGPDRIATALAVGREVATVGKPTRVLLAKADGWADAVAGGAYASAQGVPLLLSWSDRLPEDVAAQLAAWGSSETVLLGGTASLSPEVANAIPGASRRVAGPERAATAVAIARDLWGRSAGRADDAWVVMDGYSETGWWSALAAGPLAGVGAAPGLLVDPSGHLPGATEDYLDALNYSASRRARPAMMRPVPIQVRDRLASLFAIPR